MPHRHHHLSHLSGRLGNQQHQHQHHLTSLLGKAVSDGGTQRESQAGAASLVIQLPTTSANTSGENELEAVRPEQQQVAPTHGNLLGAREPQQQQQQQQKKNAVPVAAAVKDYNCHHQAATRDLMLNSHQQSRRNRQRGGAGAQQHRHRYLHAHLAAAAGSTGGSWAAMTLDSQAQQRAGRRRSELELDLEQEQRQQLAETASDNNSELESSSSSSSSSITPPPNYHEIPGVVPSYHGRSSGPPPAYDDVVNPNAQPPSYQALFGQMREARKSSNGLVDLLRQLFLVLIGTIGCTMIIGFLLLIPITMILVGFFYINECRAENIPSFLVVGGFVWITKNMLNCYNQFKKDSQTINRPPPPPAGRRPPTIVTTTTTTTAPTTASSTSGAGGQTTATSGQLQEVIATSAPATTTTTEQATNQQQRNHSTTTTTTTTTRPASGRQIRQPQMIGLTSYKCESLLNYFLVVWFLAGCIVVYRIYEPDYDNPLSLSYCNRTVYLYAFWLLTSAFIMMALVLSCLCCLMASSLMSCSHGR